MANPQVVTNMPGTFPMREKEVQPLCLLPPPTPPHSDEGVDGLPGQNNTPGEAAYPGYKPYNNTTSSSNPSPASSACKPTGSPPAGFPATWHPVTGWNKLQARMSHGGRHHADLAELPSSTPGLPESDDEAKPQAPPPSPSSAPSPAPRRPASTSGSTSSSLYSANSGSEDQSNDDNNDNNNASQDDSAPTTGHTTLLSSPAGADFEAPRGPPIPTTPSPPPPPPPHPRTTAAQLAMAKLQDDLCRVLADAVRAAHQRGREQALDEVRRSLRGRAAARHVSTAEARILRREADAVGESMMMVTKTTKMMMGSAAVESWEEYVEAGIRDAQEALGGTMALELEGFCGK